MGYFPSGFLPSTGGTNPPIVAGGVEWSKLAFERIRTKYGVMVKQLSTNLTFKVLLIKDWETMSQHMGQELAAMQTEAPKALVCFNTDDYLTVIQGEPVIEVNTGVRWVPNSAKPHWTANNVHTSDLWLCVTGGRQG